MKFTTISKIPNISQMLIIPFLSMHYRYTKPDVSTPEYENEIILSRLQKLSNHE